MTARRALLLLVAVWTTAGAAWADEIASASPSGDGGDPSQRAGEDEAEPEGATEGADASDTEVLPPGARPAWMWSELAWQAKKDGDLDAALSAFEGALQAGGEAQSIHLEMGWIERDLEHWPEAREHFKAVLDGEDMERRRIAMAELRALPRIVWGDLYAEGYGWHRLLWQQSANFVPTVRLRAFLHPIPKVDLDPYLYVQFSRDVASRGEGPQGYPLIYADNHLMFGGGVQFRFWQRRVGLFAQIGPAVNLLRDGTAPVKLDVRAGGWLGLSHPRCHPLVPTAEPYVTSPMAFCAETYDELVYVSRFSHNLVLSLRGRIGFTLLQTGPVAWQPILEGRLIKDIDNDYWNNLVDAGIGHRWRLLWPFGLDLMLGIHAGTYMGLQNVDAAPTPGQYLELRLQAATYVAF